MTRALEPSSAGAYLPYVSAPPEPAKLWQLAQLVRHRSPPSCSPPSSGDPAGRGGPPPLDWMYAASWSISGIVYFGFLAGACTAPNASGMRPLSTWNTTDDAPTPTRLGPPAPPCRFRPWQVEQPWRYRSRPALTAID